MSRRIKILDWQEKLHYHRKKCTEKKDLNKSKIQRRYTKWNLLLNKFKNRIQLFEEEKTGWGSKRPNVSKQVSSWIAKLGDNKSEH